MLITGIATTVFASPFQKRLSRALIDKPDLSEHTQCKNNVLTEEGSQFMFTFYTQKRCLYQCQVEEALRLA